MSRGYWSSSNDLEMSSPMDISLRNLNFSTLVNNPDEKIKPAALSQNEVSFGDCADEKSVKMEQNSASNDHYPPQSETPNLGMIYNPSCENLMKNSSSENSDEDEATYTGKRVVYNKNTNYNAKKIDSISLIFNANLKSRNLFDKNRTEGLPAKKIAKPERISDESLEDKFEKAVPRFSRQSRNSNYYDSMKEYRNRASRGQSMFKTLDEREEEKQREQFNRLIWGGYHKPQPINDRNSIHPDLEEDEEAVFLEDAKPNPVSYPQKGVIKRKRISRHSKSISKFM